MSLWPMQLKSIVILNLLQLGGECDHKIQCWEHDSILVQILQDIQKLSQEPILLHQALQALWQ